MENYEKALLYAYPALEGVIDAFDAVFLKRALDSYASGRTALLEAERLIEKIAEKDLYISLKLKLDRILEKFTPYERKHFSYKYFKDLPAEEYENFDAVSRAYFRRPQKLLLKFAKALERAGLTGEWFDRTCMKTDLFPELLRRIAARERSECPYDCQS